MSVLLLYSGIVLVAVPLMLMIGFATYIFFSFMRDDAMIMGIVNVAFLIMGIGGCLIAAYYAINALVKDDTTPLALLSDVRENFQETALSQRG